MRSTPRPRSALLRLWRQLSPKRRKQFVLVLVLMVAGAVAEVVALGAIVPFLALVAEPERLAKQPAVAQLMAWLNIQDSSQLLFVLTVVFVIAAIGAGVVRIVLVWVSGKYVFMLGYDLSVRLYEKILNQPYSYHVQHNTSETIAGINKVHIVTGSFLLPLMLMISALIIGLFIVSALIFIDPVISTSAFVGFGLIYLLVTLATKGRLDANSKTIARMQSRRIQAVQEGLGGIRDILIDNIQPFFVKRFGSYDAQFRNALATTLFISAAPRFVIETAGMVMIALLAYVLSRDGGLVTVLPVLGALALGAQRLLPLMQVVYSSRTTMAGNAHVLQDLLVTLEAPDPVESRDPSRQKLPFERQISFEHVTFGYVGDQPPVVEDLDFTIPKGAKIGIVGRTGSGKSTIMDLLMGLLEPSSGRVEIDGRALDGSTRRAWQKRIAHVPQSIFLADASIAENIAFGIETTKIDAVRVREAARQARLSEFIDDLPDGYETVVGENGVRLSGGQRQRIGIARALYKDADVLVLDEATSALDTATEAAVMDAIERLEREMTVVIIAHRLSTISFCDQVIRLEAGRVAETGSYHDIVAEQARLPTH